MSEDLYDEFGNYVGPELDNESDEEFTEENKHESEWADERDEDMNIDRQGII